MAVVEAGGKQRHIFASNKLAEIVGASQQIEQLGLEARGMQLSGEPVLAAAGRVVHIAPSRDEAVGLVSRLTTWALREAPGLDVCGVVEDVEDRDFAAAMRRATRRLPVVRASRPAATSRFLRLPILADCATSGLPAAKMEGEEGRGEGRRPFSRVAATKLDRKQPAYDRIRQALHPHKPAYALESIERHFAADEVGWVAVVHADGNGVGSRALEASASPDALRDFSQALVDSGTASLRHGVAAVGVGDQPVDILPLVWGGDDLTVLLAGRLAMPFTLAYLRAFEEETRQRGLNLTARAGIAYVKPHYPFYAAYELAEQLSDRARAAGRSAVDLHVLFDSNHPDLDVVRSRRPLRDEPYVLDGDRERGLHGAWRLLTERGEDGERLISRSVAHQYRDAIVRGMLSGARHLTERLRRIRPELEKLEKLADDPAVVLDALDLCSVGNPPARVPA